VGLTFWGIAAVGLGITGIFLTVTYLTVEAQRLRRDNRRERDDEQ
jgi:hypothetical protein